MTTRNPREDDQPDAMNQGVHIEIHTNGFGVVCDCGVIVPLEEWEMHCEGEGE